MALDYNMIEPIERVRQTGESWCWAASTQMISNYHYIKLATPTVFTQCKIAANQINRLRGTSLTCMNCLSGVPSEPILAICNDYLFMQEFNTLLSVDYNLESSFIDSIGFTFLDIISQIKNKEQPLIASIIEAVNACDAYHIVAIKGYWNFPNLFSLIICDPSNPNSQTIGRLRIIPLRDSSSNAAIKFCSFISDIKFNAAFFLSHRRIQTTVVKSLKPRKKSKDELLFLALAEQLMQDLKDIETQKITNKNTIIIPVRYISRPKLENSANLNLDNVSTDYIVNTLITGSDTLKFETTVQFLDGKWQVINAEQSLRSLPKTITVAENVKIKFSNDDITQFIDYNFLEKPENQATKLLPQAHYEVVKIPPFNYEFYRFSYEESFYWIPLDNYPDLDLLKTKVYAENIALSILRNKSYSFSKDFGKFISEK